MVSLIYNFKLQTGTKQNQLHFSDRRWGTLRHDQIILITSTSVTLSPQPRRLFPTESQRGHTDRLRPVRSSSRSGSQWAPSCGPSPCRTASPAPWKETQAHACYITTRRYNPSYTQGPQPHRHANLQMVWLSKHYCCDSKNDDKPVQISYANTANFIFNYLQGKRNLSLNSNTFCRMV